MIRTRMMLLLACLLFVVAFTTIFKVSIYTCLNQLYQYCPINCPTFHSKPLSSPLQTNIYSCCVYCISYLYLIPCLISLSLSFTLSGLTLCTDNDDYIHLFYTVGRRNLSNGWPEVLDPKIQMTNKFPWVISKVAH
jgi:hypothetical protein